MKCYCDNCDWAGEESDILVKLIDAPDLAERLDPGSEVPVGECPECSCFCYFRTDASTVTVIQNGDHTPGPWVLMGPCTGGYAINSPSIEVNASRETAKYYQTLTIATQRDPHPFHKGGISDAQAKANARLIASSPRLLAALKRFTDAAHLGDVDLDDEDKEMLNEAECAVAEALGLPTPQLWPIDE